MLLPPNVLIVSRCRLALVTLAFVMSMFLMPLLEVLGPNGR